jgi:hypothetical protein
MDYIYSGQFSIINKIEFKDYNLSKNNEIVYEIVQHLNNYNNIYNISENISLGQLTAIEINDEKFICQPQTKSILIYLIFLTNSHITIQEKEIEIEKGTIIIFPDEWFFYFKLTKTKVIIGTIYEFKD